MRSITSRVNQLARAVPRTTRALIRHLDASVRAQGATGTARALVAYVGDTVRHHGLGGAARAILDDLDDLDDARDDVAPASVPVVPAAAPEPVAPPRAKPVNWELRSSAELVDHIIAHHHAGVRAALPELIAAARDVERTHATHAAVPRGLTDLLEALAPELDGHMRREETMIFPVLRTGARGGGDLDMPMRMMERDHDAHADVMERIHALTGALTPPADASERWRALYADLAAFAADLRQHVYLENHILFARATTGDRW